jgi:O-antigen/teichoic acid export membrane protein
LGELVFAATSLVVLILLGKLGGARVLGMYTFSMALVTPAIIFTNLHLRPAYVVEPPGRWEFGHYLALRSVGAPSVMIFAATVGLLAGYDPKLISVLLAVAVFRVAESMSDIVLAEPQRDENMRRMGVSRAARGCLLLGGVLVGIIALEDPALGIWLGALATLLLTLTYDRKTLHLYGGYAPHFQKAKLVSLVRRALPAGLAAGLLNLGGNVPTYVLEAQHDLTTVGQFAALVSIISAGGVVNVIVGNASIPRLARNAFSDPSAFRRLLARLLGLITLAHSLIIGATWLLGSLYLGLYGSEFAHLHTELMWAAAVGLLAGWTNILSQAVMSMGRFRAQMWTNGSAVAPAALLAWAWIPDQPLLGGLGVLAAVATYRAVIYLAIVSGGRAVAADAPPA